MRFPRLRFTLAQFLLLIALFALLLATGITIVRHRRQRAVWTTAVQFSPDGRTLAVALGRASGLGGRASVVLWDLHSGRRRATLTGRRETIVTLGFTPDSATLVSGSGDIGKPTEILLWDVATARLRARLAGHSIVGGVTSVAISPDGKTIISAGFDGTARRWDVVTARELSTLADLGVQGFCNAAISPDGRSFAWTDARGNISLRDINTHESIATLPTDSPAIRLAFAPSGELLAAVEWDFTNRATTLKLWNVSTQSVVHTFDTGWFGATSPVFSPDGRRLAVVAGEVVKVWDLQRERETQRFRTGPGIGSIAFSPDGETLAIASGEVKLWHLPSDRVNSIPVTEEPFNWYALAAGFLAWTIAVASVRARRLSGTSILLGVAWALPAVTLLIVWETDWGWTGLSRRLTAHCALLMFGPVLASLRAQKVGVRGLFAGELLWGFKGLCIAAFLMLVTIGHVGALAPLALNLLTVFAVIGLLRVRTDRARGAPWQHWVGLGVAIVEPMVLAALFAFRGWY